MRSLSYLLFRDLYFKFFFQIFFKPDNLLFPQNQAFLRLTVWKFHKINRLEFRHILIHLFLSVAGRLSNHYIGKIKERAFIRLGKSVAGFDQRT